MNITEAESFDYFDQDSLNEDQPKVEQDTASEVVEQVESNVKPKPKPRLFRQTAEKSETEHELSTSSPESSTKEPLRELSASPRNIGHLPRRHHLPQLSITQSSPVIEQAATDFEGEEIAAEPSGQSSELERQTSGEKESQESVGESGGNKLLNRAKSLKRSFRLLKFHSRFIKSKSEDKSSTIRTHSFSSTPSPTPERQPSISSPLRQTPDEEHQQSSSHGSQNEDHEKESETRDVGESDIFGVHIHNTDRKLKTSQPVLNPAVKVHVVDGATGKYLLKKNKERNVASYYENQNENVDYILPLMTQPCDLLTRIRYPRYPIWEELLVYNEDYNHFQREGVVLFFEILDFFSFGKPLSSKQGPRSDHWCYRVAWAFLRLVSSNGHPNTGTKVRLQLYKPLSESVSRDTKSFESSDLFQWWNKSNRLYFPGSIFVTIKSIPINETRRSAQPSLRSLLPLQPETGTSVVSNPGSPTGKSQQSVSSREEPKKTTVWSKVEGQMSKVPCHRWHELAAGNNKSCYISKFSHDGQKIVCGASVFTAYMAKEKRSSVFLFELPSGKFLKRVNGFHLGTIYDLDWSNDDQLLVSASNDCTAQVWRLHKDHLTSLVLPHPCFVFSSKFNPQDSNIIFTGAYDGLIRIWTIKKSLEFLSYDPQLLQELDGSHGQVLCLTWKHYSNLNAYCLFSGGTKGNIMCWKQKDPNSELWLLGSRIKVKELYNIAINAIKIHPFGNKLVLFCRDGIQRVIDYKLEIVVQRYYGSLNTRHLIRGTISPCGRYVFAGSEDGLVHVWNTDTGDRIYIYKDLPFKDSITSVDYHPLDNILAISGLNARTISVCLFRHSYEKASSTLTVASGVGNKRSPARKVLRKSQTIDESSHRDNKSRVKVHRAMRKLEIALKMGFSESAEIQEANDDSVDKN